ncbi:MAG: holo-ACP synthase [bacterium]
MIIGIGVDILEVGRMKRAIERWGDAFTEKIFTAIEINYCRSKKYPEQHFAARFAVKEAFSKALQTGWSGVFRWKDVEVVNNPQSGAPQLTAHNKVGEMLGKNKVNVSISHTEHTVIAFVIIEKLE